MASSADGESATSTNGLRVYRPGERFVDLSVRRSTGLPRASFACFKVAKSQSRLLSSACRHSFAGNKQYALNLMHGRTNGESWLITEGSPCSCCGALLTSPTRQPQLRLSRAKTLTAKTFCGCATRKSRALLNFGAASPQITAILNFEELVSPTPTPSQDQDPQLCRHRSSRQDAYSQG